MTDHTQQYRLTEAGDQKRLQELTGRDPEALSDVSTELGLARFLAERCATSNPALCNSVLSTIGKLAIAAERHAVATNELLARPALRGFVQEVIGAVCEELQKLPDAERIIENVARRLDGALVKVRNEPTENTKLLAYEGNRP